MWGNLLGWLLAGAIGLLMGLLLYVFAVPPTPTLPTNSAKLEPALKQIALPTPLDSVFTAGTKEGDAGDLYRQAIDECAAHRRLYEAENVPTGKETDLKAVDFLVKARDMKSCRLFTKNVGELVNYDNAHASLDDIQAVGDAAVTVGLLNLRKTPPNSKRALQLFEGAFALGMHLYEERLTWAEYQAAHDLLQKASSGLGSYYEDKKNRTLAETQRWQALHDFADSERAYTTKLHEAWQIVQQISEDSPAQTGGLQAGRYAGDIFKIAASKEADPMFRVEALKHIGCYKYNYLNKGDHFKSLRFINDYSQKSDLPSSVKTAAEAAKELTVEKYRMIGGSA